MILRPGARGEEVEILQDLLKHNGFDCGISDGLFGTKTLQALRDFQEAKGLKVDGIAGPKTMSALRGVSDDKKLWYPKAIIVNNRMRTRGIYADGAPRGAIVHFTAGHFGTMKRALNTINGGFKDGFAYLCIASTGEMIQAHPLNEWGYHAGESFWPGLGRGVSNDLVGIEINCAGKLKKVDGKFMSWFGLEIPENEVRESTPDYECDPGFYHKYTPQQEKTLIEFILWMKAQWPNIFNLDYVLGHDEVAGKKGLGYFRKNDPGASLSVPMTKFREMLKSEYERFSQDPSQVS